jgi:hypothetical protein
VRRNPQHRSILIAVSATSAPPFQSLRHQRKVFHPVMNCFMRQTLPTVNRTYFLMNIFALSSFAHTKKHNRTLLFGSTLLKHDCHFDYWIQSLNMRLRVCYLDCHDAGLCCYLVIHTENLLRPLQLFHFHLWRIYWFSFVCWEYNLVNLQWWRNGLRH